MTDAEFSALKRKTRELEFNEHFLFSNSIIEDEILSKCNENKKCQQDFDRWVASKYFSNEKLIEKVHEEVELQRKLSEERKQEIGIMTPEQFFNTKLFKKKIMTNKLRSRAYFKIKRAINSCCNVEQLDIALTMIALHTSIDEVFCLQQLHKEKTESLKITFEDDSLTEFHKKLTP